ncbi:hypothetical protein ACFE04_028324 [Oxalis oulophora]
MEEDDDSGDGSNGVTITSSQNQVKVLSSKLKPVFRCPFCDMLFKEATTISLCIHTCQCLSDGVWIDPDLVDNSDGIFCLSEIDPYGDLCLNGGVYSVLDMVVFKNKIVLFAANRFIEDPCGD